MNVLQHIAIIMDGNGRWATARGKKRTDGHQAGVETAKKIIQHAAAVRIPVLTLWCFSTENWRRPQLEVMTLMQLFKRFAKDAGQQFHEHDIRITLIGRRSTLDRELVAVMEEIETLTQHNCGLHLRVAINYSGTQEVVDAANRLAERRVPLTDHSLRTEILDNIPDYDLVIRTGGDWRVSDFPIRHAELFVTSTLFPDLTTDEFDYITKQYQTRERCFGGIKTTA